jgi:predicted Fe-Mo cluster-binding NifX family protein
MRTAFSLWNERIAPVFDVAKHLWIVDVAEGRIVGQTGRRFSSDDPRERAMRLTTLQVEQLVCGAITRSSYDALTEHGIQVISFITGDLNQVVQACLKDRLKDGSLAMPGCRRGKRHGARRYPCKQEAE